MRIYSTAYELMSETGRNLYEMGLEVKPKTYQNKNIQDNPDYTTEVSMQNLGQMRSLKKEYREKFLIREKLGNYEEKYGKSFYPLFRSLIIPIQKG